MRTQTIKEVAALDGSSAVKLDIENGILVATIDNPPVNAGSWGVRRGLLEALMQARAAGGIEAIVIIGAGSTFISGSDIHEFAQPLREPTVPQVIMAIEDCPKPVVAAIHGAGLGGGYEIALGCDYRIADKEAVVGLPEVRLGIIPGAGGTQRLPRLTGMSRAVELITSGRRVGAHEAVELSMVDIIADGPLRAAAVNAAKSLHGKKRRLRDYSIPAEPPEKIDAARSKALRGAKGLASVPCALKVLEQTPLMDFDSALALERSTFETLRYGEQACALRYQFFAERRARQVEGLEASTSRDIGKVGILGAGTMGADIAICFLESGYRVTLIDRTQDALDIGVSRIHAHFQRSSAKQDRVKATASRQLASLRATTDIAALAEVDLLLEAVFEDMDVKIAVMQQLGKLAKPGAVIASNTSYLDLDRLAAATGRAHDVVGLHFFSPAHIMKLLEIVRGRKTSTPVLATALALGKQLKKSPIISAVGEGFIGNRIYSAYRRQCELMVQEGASPWEIDIALENFGFSMGPFAVSDISGLDIAWRTRQRLASKRDPRERYVKIADRLCEAGRLGRKTGAGWYDYGSADKRGIASVETERIISECRTEDGYVARLFSSEDIVTRALISMVNEAVNTLSEGIASRASDIDLAMVKGYGFPAYRGGPLYWAASRPPGFLEDALNDLEKVTGFGFKRGNLCLLRALQSHTQSEQPT
ncbi:3-hydroxyacyl-CoA dehydrogenase NAD-binding domain-containing protein [Rhizobium sp. L1K21]|uniref:3-hydroxyacyl-CoA dehydrogenase NAD-binding domain-containing protein n=1 Tax=Rhizobium sp. L1K21 TaxID=2954933 RepID=UPI0020930A7E|nr:3-hydroxyacyl-CoA dehydrogenase NAD-binding domain-containing protein [Rhizobium sp. L1K21]MCO6188427.1 3-hydroxyacyl-CoA dehydrogenase NAD-binding domain-containing protein [Rhizobium sp. L1K21]